MGKGDERGDITIHAGVSTFVPKTSSEASKMLEAALLQMDDIISGACIESNNEGAAEWKDSVKEAARNLVTAIKSCPSLPSTPDPATVEILLKWMQPDRLRKLEDERGALRMEVSVLSEQVEAQSNKIQELESMLREKKDSLRRMEEALQQEMLSRSALETQKLELLSSMSEMKLRQASLEHENLVLRSTSPVLNGEKFGRHTSQYSSLPRPVSSSKKGVVFGKVPSLTSGTQTTVPLTIRGASARCLSAPTLGCN